MKEEIQKAANEYACTDGVHYGSGEATSRARHFKAGANWYSQFQTEGLKELLQKFAEEYYHDKTGAALSAKHFVHQLKETEKLPANQSKP